jgi:integrase/recombinase XerD
MNMNEVQQILNVLYKNLNNCNHDDAYKYKTIIRDIAVIELLFASGMRVSELCQLTASDINLEEGVIKILGKGNKERIIQICQNETIKALRVYRNLYFEQIQVESLFFINRLGRGLSAQSVRLMIKNYIKQTEINKHITPHTFRHTFATLLLEEDVDIKYIQSLLGHSSISVTQIYTHVNTEKQKQILSSKHPRRKMNFTIY